jgi:hypothetical protein
VSLLDGRDFPSIEDLEHRDLEDFAANSVLLDFTCGKENPTVPYIGAAIRDECGLDDDTRSIGEVPSRSLLSRLTDHYLQIIANRAPVGFEAEFVNQREESICYRGILMPFSSDGDAIDFIYGVINWKKGESAQPGFGEASPLPVVEMQPAAIERESAAIEGIADIPLDLTDLAGPDEHLTWEDSPSAEHEIVAPSFADTDESDDAPPIALDDDAGLADRLWAARETAEAAKAGEGRTRTALYRALSLAYDFAVAARSNAEDYAELLEESGVKAQARAPMTPIVKLVFGIDYDKARLTEFAAALSFAQRQDLPQGAFQGFIESQAGGLKALVAAERQARRPEARPDTAGETARRKLRSASALELATVPAEQEFALAIVRKSAAGGYEAVALIEDEALVEKAIRKA